VFLFEKRSVRVAWWGYLIPFYLVRLLTVIKEGDFGKRANLEIFAPGKGR
jgi:hypothetical protein